MIERYLHNMICGLNEYWCEWWNDEIWSHTFGIMYELCLFVYIKYNTPMFNRDPQASLII